MIGYEHLRFIATLGNFKHHPKWTREDISFVFTNYLASKLSLKYTYHD